MSYDVITPAYYKTFQPDTPYHDGAEGWTKAPWPTWGENPNLAGKRTLATDGLGIIAVSGLGAADQPRHPRRARGGHRAPRALGSPDGLGAYFKTAYTQPISPQGRGAVTVASYKPIDGLGCSPCAAAAAQAAAGFGADASPPPVPMQSAGYSGPLWRALQLAGTAAGAYHGYKRNQSVVSAITWAFFGGVAPVLALPIAAAQGFAKPKR